MPIWHFSSILANKNCFNPQYFLINWSTELEAISQLYIFWETTRANKNCSFVSSTLSEENHMWQKQNKTLENNMGIREIVISFQNDTMYSLIEYGCYKKIWNTIVFTATLRLFWRGNKWGNYKNVLFNFIYKF